MQSASHTVRLLTFNIRQGGRSRMEAITETITRHDPDIAVITEYRASTARVLPERLVAHGLVHHASSDPHMSENGVFIASRFPFRLVQDPDRPSPSPRHWLEAEFKHFRLGAIYNAVHQAGWQAFQAWLLDLMLARRHSRFVAMGDFNWLEMGDGGNQREGIVECLRELGYVDAWRKLNPDVHEYSWTNHNGTRTRVDYAFLSPRVARRLARVWYIHDERECDISDHCPLVVDLNTPSAFTLRRK
jgi:exonuclease III